MAANSFKSFFYHRFDAWLKRRVPSRSHHQLSRKNIFIMPTKFGFAYLFFVFLLFLLATNYQNNIIMLMSYLLASFFISVMMHSFYNFSGLGFKSTIKHSGFAKQTINIPITITAAKQHFDLTLSFAKQPKHLKQQQQKIYLEQCHAGNTDLILPYVAKQRGTVDIGRIKIASEYSFGLFISWAVLDFSHQITVYPQPKKIITNQYRLAGQDDHNANTTNYANQSAGLDDFAELKDYVLGESRARIAWKQFARGQGRYTKHYQSQQGSLHWLKLSEMPSVSLESQLSYLCYLVLEYSHSGQHFGLDLTVNGHSGVSDVYKKIAPDLGFLHQSACLTALANFNQWVRES